jgi:hypothetical protein
MFEIKGLHQKHNMIGTVVFNLLAISTSFQSEVQHLRTGAGF